MQLALSEPLLLIDNSIGQDLQNSTMSIGAPRGKVFPKKQGMPGAGIFAQLPSHNALPAALSDADHKLKIMDDIDKLNRLFTQCSGMQRFYDKCSQVKTADCDEVVLLAMLNGAKVTLEDFSAILNNNAVYASLFLSSTVGLLFSPPDAIASLENDEPRKLVYFSAIGASVLFNIMNVLMAVFALYAKNKILRESDALGYLIRAQSNVIVSASCLGVGIFGLIFAIFPLVDLVYGRMCMIAALIAFACMLPFCYWQFSQGWSNHAGFYYMAQGKRALKAQAKGIGKERKLKPVKKLITKKTMIKGNSTQSSDTPIPSSTTSSTPLPTAAAESGTTTIEKNDDDAFTRHDPYDPGIAWYNYQRCANIGQFFSSFDTDESGIVDLADYMNILQSIETKGEMVEGSGNKALDETIVEKEDEE